MEKVCFENTLTDEAGRTSILYYTVFAEQADAFFPEGYSLLVEKRTAQSSETAVVHRIGNQSEVLILAERLCRNSVTPVSLSDIAEDYITGKALI